MGFVDLFDMLKTAVAGLPAVGVLLMLHKYRNERFNRIDQSHKELNKKVDRLDTDVDGLTRQISSIVNDIEKRFLTREEHTEEVKRRDTNIVELNRNLGALNDHLFNLASRSPRQP